MKTKFILMLAGGTALLFAADAPKKQPSEIDKLQARIATLEERVNALETRLSFAPGAPSLHPPEPSPQLRFLEEPPNIGSMDINGLKVFKVPLKAQVTRHLQVERGSAELWRDGRKMLEGRQQPRSNGSD